jgi:DNA repair protein RadC
MELDTREGHRQRLRDKFLTTGLSALHDYEIVELLLTLGTPRKDCKQQAKEAIKRFKGLRGVLDAGLEELQEIKGIGPHNAFGVKLFQSLSERYLKEKLINEQIPLISPDTVFDYLRQSMGKEKQEVFKALFLDSKNKLIDSKDLFIGSLTSSVVYPRKIMEEAIKYHASGLIFAHNHPSGDSTPSNSDKEITNNLIVAGNSMQIRVLDHIIVGGDKYFSFADAGLIREYELTYTKLRDSV